MDQYHIRNFAIIAHIDHGKSTLADRLMEATGTVTKRDMQDQLLDSNPIERERGITIKLAPVRMVYKKDSRIQNLEFRIDDDSSGKNTLILNSEFYILNLIDTPGHVDFGYEVSRSLAACEGALLVVDATQGVQAQTLANLHQAQMHKLTIIPLINKVDLPNADVEKTKQELMDLGFNEEEMLEISAKTGKNIDLVLNAIVSRIPPPQGDAEAPTRALIFSSQYDPHRGVVVFVRIVDGSLPFKDTFKGETFKGVYSNSIRFLQSGAVVTPIEVGYFNPKMKASDGLNCGEVGYIATGLKDVRLAKVGDTITIQNSELRIQNEKSSDIVPLPGYKEPKPMVFVGLFPIESDNITLARDAMEKLRLSDSAFSFRPISSLALGNGFHCGFLGLLHAEIVQERLSREFGLSLLATAPSVEYQVVMKPGASVRGGIQFRAPSRPVMNTKLSHGEEALTDAQKFVYRPQHASTTENDRIISIQSPSELPDPIYIDHIEEPVMQVRLFSPKQYVGAIMQLTQEKRGEYIDLVYHAEQAEFTYLIPLSEMIVDFFDRLKSVTEGYASLDYEFYAYQTVDAVKVDILVNYEKVDALSFLIVKDQAQRRGRELVERLAEVLPRQQFTIPVQAAIGGTVIARADIKPFRKDVIQKLYGGDRTRKDKLLEAQKRGKSKMKKVGKVAIPQTAFFDVLKKR